MLFIHNDVVAELLTMRECIEAQEHAFRQVPGGGAIQRPRLDMYVPCERDDGYYRWSTVEGTSDGILAMRMKSDIVTWPVGKDGLWRESKYCMQPGTYAGLILLLSTRNGEPLAFINDGVLQHMRVGGGAGIGAKHLARKNAETVGILGSGQLGRMLAIAALKIGLRTHIFAPEAEAPAYDAAHARTIARFDDEEALARFAAAVDVITYEFENVPVETIERILRKA